MKATETSTTADLFKLIANQEDQTPTEDDEIIVTLTEKRTGDDPAKGIFGDFKEITQDDAVKAIQAQVDEQAFSKGLLLQTCKLHLKDLQILIHLPLQDLKNLIFKLVPVRHLFWAKRTHVYKS